MVAAILYLYDCVNTGTVGRHRGTKVLCQVVRIQDRVVYSTQSVSLARVALSVFNSGVDWARVVKNPALCKGHDWNNLPASAADSAMMTSAKCYSARKQGFEVLCNKRVSTSLSEYSRGSLCMAGKFQMRFVRGNVSEGNSRVTSGTV
jgi:hypothetical protein